MKRIVKRIGITLLLLPVLAVVANNFIRVSYTSEKSMGIVEELLFGRPIEEALGPPWSENYKRWDTAARASDRVASLITDHGIEKLTLGEELGEERKEAITMSQLAFENASAISKDYLKESNVELPGKYLAYFVPAMDSWRRGFADANVDFVRQGVSDYNAFLLWMQSRKPGDFKTIR